MVADIEAKREAMEKQYVQSRRHKLQVRWSCVLYTYCQHFRQMRNPLEHLECEMSLSQ